MDQINSVSKGIFVFKNGQSKDKLRKTKKFERVNKENHKQHWYEIYSELWNDIERKIDKIQADGSYGKTLKNLLRYIQNVNTKSDGNLQTAVLLTGVNQTDHLKQFDSLSLQIENNCYSKIAIAKSMNCPNLKATIECIVGGLIHKKKESQHDDDEEEDDDDEEGSHVKLKKKQLTMAVLEAWYHQNYGHSKPGKKLVIIIADFEQFSPAVMQDLVNILSSYALRLPLVLILGIATAFKTLHNVLPFHVTSKITANVFQAESSTVVLNRILDEVILTHHCPFFLSGKSFKILMDIFLFYDYSLYGFIQGFKLFMLEQYSSNFFSSIYYQSGRLCEGMIEKLSHERCEEIRRNCMSFRRLVEDEIDSQKRKDLILDDEYFKKELIHKMKNCYRYFFQFFGSLQMLAVLLEDLPKNNLGKLHRELYPICASTDVTKLEEFQECFKLLRFTSKDKFLRKLEKIIKILEESLMDKDVIDALKHNFEKSLKKIKTYYRMIESAGMSPIKNNGSSTKDTQCLTKISTKGVSDRKEMMEKLKESAMNNPTKVVIEYEKHLCECLDYLHKIFELYLRPFNKAPPFIELFIFSDCNSVRSQIVGAPRGSMHNALSIPHHYLQCQCCATDDSDQILQTMPDVCIAYKLHLECNKFINMYDWLQAFAMVIEHNEDDENDESISPEIQARFTRATADLQFIGLIKQAKHKTDHVMRLTW